MKKIFLAIVSLCLLTIIFIPAIVQGGLVPCNPTCTTSKDAMGKNTTTCTNQCTIDDFFTMLINIYNFIVLQVATPLAVLALTIGGIIILISSGNPGAMGTGKKIFWSAVIGLILVFASYLIINFVLCTALGYCSWHTV